VSTRRRRGCCSPAPSSRPWGPSRRAPRCPLVVDPVMVASSGAQVPRGRKPPRRSSRACSARDRRHTEPGRSNCARRPGGPTNRRSASSSSAHAPRSSLAAAGRLALRRRVDAHRLEDGRRPDSRSGCTHRLCLPRARSVASHSARRRPTQLWPLQTHQKRPRRHRVGRGPRRRPEHKGDFAL